MKVLLRNPKREVEGPLSGFARLEACAGTSPTSRGGTRCCRRPRKFVRKVKPLVHVRFAADQIEEREALISCEQCGAPTPLPACAFRRLRKRAATGARSGP